MQNEITKPSNLLDDKGELIQVGWARKAYLTRNMEKVNAGKLRIKDWDCYEVFNEDFGVVFIISDVGYFGMASISFYDFKNKEYHDWAVIKLFTKGSLNMPATTTEGDVIFKKKDKIEMSFKIQGNQRILSLNYPKFWKGKGISGEITLYQDPENDSLVNAIPFKKKTKFKKKTRFVLAHKILGMPAKGKIQVGDNIYDFSEKKNSFGLLDWSRGVLPYKMGWFWSSAAGTLKGKPIAFTLGYGFGDASVASKNIFLYEGKGHKLDKLTFHFNKKDLMEDWRLTSNDGRFEMTMTPVLPKNGSLNLLFIKTGGILVFGYFTGFIILDNGEKIHIDSSDRLFGFAEAFKHRW